MFWSLERATETTVSVKIQTQTFISRKIGSHMHQILGKEGC